MENLKVGFAKVNIDPPLGIDIFGYYVPRYAKGFLDSLEADALAIKSGDTLAFIIAVDNCGIGIDLVNKITGEIEKVTGVSKDNIFICASHTHTGPYLAPQDRDLSIMHSEIINKYADFLCERVTDAAVMAQADLKDAKMGYSVVKAPDRIAYIRRYKMKDGTTMTCPPINDPNIDHPLGELDQRINLVRFDREGGRSIALVNYGIHSDTIGGELISADFEAWMRSTLDAALDIDSLFICGAQGDVGSTHVYPTESDMNDTKISFDNEMKSPGMARFVGRAIAGAVLQVWDKVLYTKVDKICIKKKIVPVAANLPKPEDLPTAHKYKELHLAGRDDLIPYTAMELTTVVAEAIRMCALENGPESFMLPMTAISLGPIAFVSIPGEPFTDIGVKIKETPGFDLILPCALTNGFFGYFPVQSAYDEGGYEARSTRYRAGVAETLVNAAKELLGKLKK